MSQKQIGGDGTNNQAGRDVVYNVSQTFQYGVSEERFQELALEQEQRALELWERNAPRLVQQAEDEFRSRAIEVTREVIKDVIADNPENLERFGEARSQVPLLKAQQSYGETGNKELVPHLSQLVAQLIGSEPQSYTEMISRRSIDCITNMNIRHLNLIATIADLQNKWFPNVVTVEMLISGLRHALGPYIGKIPTAPIEYSYIHTLGVTGDNMIGRLANVLTGTMSESSPYSLLRTANPQALTDGFRVEELPPAAKALDPDKYFVWAADTPDVKYLLPEFGNKWLKTPKKYSKTKPERPEDPAEAALIDFYESRIMSAEALKERIRGLDPELADFLDTLETFDACAFTLTPVGLMLAAQEEMIRSNGEKSELLGYFELQESADTANDAAE